MHENLRGNMYWTPHSLHKPDIYYLYLADPTVRDPYESRYIDVKVSGIQGAAEGIFAKQEQ